MTEPNTILTNGEKNFCEYGGGFGVLLSLTCLIQHLVIAIPNSTTNPMIPAYVFTIIAFIFLALQKFISVVLLIISAVFSLVIQYLWITHYSFSLVVLLLFVYHMVIIVSFFIENMPKKLKMKKVAEKAERESWSGKI